MLLLWRPCSTVLALVIGLPMVAAAEEVRVSTRDELVEALRQAKPGTTILLAPGTYAGGISQRELRGASGQPITIAAADAAHPPILEGGSGVHLSGPAHLELRDLVVAGSASNGINIDDGGRAGQPASHIVLRNLLVRDVGPTGNRDGLKLSGLDDFRVEGCRVERWGSSGSAIDMVGCHRGVVSECIFREARGDVANGVQAKGGSSEIVVRNCRFIDAGGRGVNAGGSTGQPFFRPADATVEAKHITVEDCTFVRGMSAIAFVGVDSALVQRNIIYRPGRWALRILQENTDSRFAACRNGQVLQNTIVFRSDELREAVNIGAKTAPETFTFQGNRWYCLDRPEATQRLVRLPVAETDGVYNSDPHIGETKDGDITKPAMGK